MPMNKTKPLSPELSLAVQYAIAEAQLPRWRIRGWVQRALDAAQHDLSKSMRRAQLSVRLVGLAEARRFNEGYRQKDYPTNVLTFAYGFDSDDCITADIVMCVPVLRREAREQGKEFLAHAAHLTIHGTLHAVGYDHLKPCEALRMERLETKILAAMGIPNPY